ncbi:hypothetical protein TNCT_518501 [Trichonephila clavata]|uniref:Uncharacterized protein n=1 Tax=Trichonephila clavata TaxID=2740835 RepID=A0A8X6HH85_TRICU|nr:hypothetical protein TNCT_518501 [Trichonephila clavata]
MDYIHIGVIGNEISDSLAQGVTLDIHWSVMHSTFSEVFSDDNNKKQRDGWRVPPEHVWYLKKQPYSLGSHRLSRFAYCIC